MTVTGPFQSPVVSFNDIVVFYMRDLLTKNDKQTETETELYYALVFFVFCGVFILLSQESNQCAIPEQAHLGVAGHLSTTPRWEIYIYVKEKCT